jgi:hypothetical protein
LCLHGKYDFGVATAKIARSPASVDTLALLICGLLARWLRTRIRPSAKWCWSDALSQLAAREKLWLDR